MKRKTSHTFLGREKNLNKAWNAEDGFFSFFGKPPSRYSYRLHKLQTSKSKKMKGKKEETSMVFKGEDTPFYHENQKSWRVTCIFLPL